MTLSGKRHCPRRRIRGFKLAWVCAIWKSGQQASLNCLSLRDLDEGIYEAPGAFPGRSIHHWNWFLHPQARYQFQLEKMTQCQNRDHLLDAQVNENVKSPSSPSNESLYIDFPLQNTSRFSSEIISGLSRHSTDGENGREITECLGRKERWTYKCNEVWMKNKGILLVLISQFFGSLMNVATKLLETSDENDIGMDPFQVSLQKRCTVNTWHRKRSSLFEWALLQFFA